MLNTTTAANDTSAQTTIPRGTTFDGAEWRAHRYADSYQVTRTVNAGKRGKSCEVFTVCAPIRDTDAAMDEVAPAILWAVREGVSVDTMRATLSDLALAGWTFHATTKRGIDVPRGGAIQVDSDLVRATFGETEFLVTFTAIMGSPSGRSFRHDTIVGAQGRKDASKAYQWAQDPTNRARLVAMTLPAFRAEMSAIGVRIS